MINWIQYLGISIQIKIEGLIRGLKTQNVNCKTKLNIESKILEDSNKSILILKQPNNPKIIVLQRLGLSLNGYPIQVII